MPWQEIKPMEKRLEFALRAQRCENFRALCREYGISPRVGYKWKNRLLEEGIWQLARIFHRSIILAVCHWMVLRGGDFGVFFARGA